MRVHLILALVLPILASAQNDHDARILAYRGLRYACGDSVTPVLRIENAGSTSMFSCVVETWKNGAVDNTFDWVLALPAITNEVRQPAFPAVAAMEGDVLEFHIISVNGNPDQDPVGNILQITVVAEPITCTQQIMEVEVFTDNAPGETSWVIRNAAGQAVAQGGGYTVPNATATQWVVLDLETCYGLELNDTGGDGMAGGHLNVYCDGVELISMDGSTFTEAAYEGLRSGMSVGVEEAPSAAILSVRPVPAIGSVTIDLPRTTGPSRLSLRDGGGRMLREVNVQGMEGPLVLDLVGVAPGLYFLDLTQADGRMVQRVVVGR